jgi:EmrB/QacA subfamily drug resistance transporter
VSRNAANGAASAAVALSAPAATAPAAAPPARRQSAHEDGEGGHPRRGLIFFVVSLALFMASIDLTVVATALPSIQKDLGAGIEWSGWTITIYSLGQVLVMPLAGKLSDLYGRKRIFLIAAVIFTLASLACGLSTNIYMLVALRFVQAIGGGAFMPSATGIVSDHFGKNRDRAIGMFSSIFPIGGILGPILGGIFVTSLSWRYIFFVNIPIGVLVIVLGAILIPRSLPRPSRKLDVLGVVLLVLLMLSFMLAITSLGSGTTGVLDPVFYVPMSAAVVFVLLFVWRMRRAEAPFIPLELLVKRGFAVMNVLNLVFGASALGFSVLIPVYAADRFGIEPLQAGTLLSARAIGSICVAGLAVFALRRTGYRLPIMVGFAASATGLVAMAFVPADATAYLWLLVAGGVSGIGMGLATPASNNAIMQLAPEQIASISGLRGMFRNGGSILSVSIATALVARSGDPGSTLAVLFVVFAGLLVLSIPLILFVPEHKGSW